MLRGAGAMVLEWVVQSTSSSPSAHRGRLWVPAAGGPPLRTLKRSLGVSFRNRNCLARWGALPPSTMHVGDRQHGKAPSHGCSLQDFAWRRRSSRTRSASQRLWSRLPWYRPPFCASGGLRDAGSPFRWYWAEGEPGAAMVRHRGRRRPERNGLRIRPGDARHLSTMRSRSEAAAPRGRRGMAPGGR